MAILEINLKTIKKGNINHLKEVEKLGV